MSTDTATLPNVPKRRTLRDLYVKGVLKTLTDDPEEEGVTFWVQKLTPILSKECRDNASAVRAKVKALRYSKDEELRLAMATLADLEGYLDDRETLIRLIEGEQFRQQRASMEAEVAEEEDSKWAKDGYLEGLRKAWVDGLGQEWLIDKTEESVACYEALRMFGEEVDERFAPVERSIIAQHAGDTDEQLRNKLIDILIDMRADEEWLDEFKKWEVYFSVRDPDDHSKYAFENRQAVDELEEQTYTELVNIIAELNVDTQEGKD